MKVKLSIKAPGADLGNAQPSITKDKSTKEPDEWETKGHMQDLINAHQIINDPVKMAAVHKMVGRHQKAMKSIQDIKDYSNAKYGVQSLKNQPDSDDDNDND